MEMELFVSNGMNSLRKTVSKFTCVEPGVRFNPNSESLKKLYTYLLCDNFIKVNTGYDKTVIVVITPT